MQAQRKIPPQDTVSPVSTPPVQLAKKTSHHSFYRLLRVWLKQTHVESKAAATIILLSVIAVVGTFVVFSSYPPLGPDPSTVLSLLVVDSILLLLAALVVVRRVVNLWVARKTGLGGSRLYSRLVLLFSVIAVTPAVLIMTLATVFFNVGLEQWFADRVQTALSGSLEVAEAYLAEHKNIIKADAAAMAHDLNRQALTLMADDHAYVGVLRTQMLLRSLTEAAIIDSKKNIVVTAELGYPTGERQLSEINPNMLSDAERGEIVVLTNTDDNRVHALVHLDRFVDAYLYIGRPVDPRAIYFTEKTRAAVEAYQELERSRSKLQIAISSLIVIIALLLLLAAIWLGLVLAQRLLQPIMALVNAAERIREGDLDVKVPVSQQNDELRTLTLAFNRMISQVSTQRSALLEVNQQLDVRRRFIEAVLSGVSAGVIGLDPQGQVRVINQRAENIINRPHAAIVGANIIDLLPAAGSIFAEFILNPEKAVEAQIVTGDDALRRTLLVRLSTQEVEGAVTGYVLTFDDITDFLRVQKGAAWADVAQKLAHEIKNPLTPIQLSAERLARKFLPQITKDASIFEQCTNTIIRQVGDLQLLVDEFSSFARMPQPKRKRADLLQLCRDVIQLHSNAYPDLEISLNTTDTAVIFDCDQTMMRQALTNLVKNAIEAITDYRTSHPDNTSYTGKISLTLNKNFNEIFLILSDNGIGFTSDNTDQFIKPYVTTKDSGTGLGLSIVKKIIEDHAGILKIEAAVPHGAVITMRFVASEQQ